mgnify:CR=1 FL=1
MTNFDELIWDNNSLICCKWWRNILSSQLLWRNIRIYLLVIHFFRHVDMLYRSVFNKVFELFFFCFGWLFLLLFEIFFLICEHFIFIIVFIFTHLSWWIKLFILRRLYINEPFFPKESLIIWKFWVRSLFQKSLKLE